MEWFDWLILLSIGAVGGFLAGLLGVGGGLIFVPVLAHYFHGMGMSDGEMVKHTLANSIFLVLISGVSGIYRQYQLGQWDWKRTLSIGIPGAIIALVWSYFIRTGNWYQKEVFQLVFLAFLFISISNMLFGKNDHAPASNETKKPTNYPIDFLVAILSGSVVALSGLGGGVIMVPLFRMMLKMPMKSATALSLSIIPLLSIGPVFSYLFSNPTFKAETLHTGYLIWPIVLPMALGVLIFASIGLKFSKRMPVLYLRIIFALLSITIFIKTLIDIYQ